MKFNITLNDQDYIRFNQKYILTSREGKRTLRMVRLVPIVMCSLAVFCMAIAGAERGLLITEIIGLTIACIVMELFTKKFLIWSVTKAALRMKKDGKLPYSPEAVVEFGENEILEDSDEMTITAPYRSIHRVDMDDEYIFLFKDAMQGFILPIRCLEGREQEVREYVREKTGI